MALRKFERIEVVGTAIKVTNAGDGLSKAMQVDPCELHVRERVFIVIEAEVGPITFKPATDSGGLIRVHTLKSGTATLVDEALVKDVLEEQRIKIEEALGIERLDFGGEDSDDE